MTLEQKDELKLLTPANENGKFAVSIFASMTRKQALALERLQGRRWITLIDVSPIMHGSRRVLHRVFLLSDEARVWVKTEIERLGDAR